MVLSPSIQSPSPGTSPLISSQTCHFPFPSAVTLLMRLTSHPIPGVSLWLWPDHSKQCFFSSHGYAIQPVTLLGWQGCRQAIKSGSNGLDRVLKRELQVEAEEGESTSSLLPTSGRPPTFFLFFKDPCHDSRGKSSSIINWRNTLGKDDVTEPKGD